MSIQTLLMPSISERLLSERRLEQQRAEAEQRRKAAGLPHEVHYFHQVDDPYSALAATALQLLVARYDVTVCPHVVGPVPDTAAPERDKLVAYSRRDAQLLARHWACLTLIQGASRRRATAPTLLAYWSQPSRTAGF